MISIALALMAATVSPTPIAAAPATPEAIAYAKCGPEGYNDFSDEHGPNCERAGWNGVSYEAPELKQAWGDLAFAAGKCYPAMSAGEQIELESLINNSPPKRRGFMRALFFGGRNDKSPALSRDVCVDLMSDLLGKVAKLKGSSDGR